jgi:hypothetical protein
MGARLTNAKKKARRRRHKKTRDRQAAAIEQTQRSNGRKS